MEQYWQEFLALYILNFLNLISPGPSGLLTARNSMAFHRTSGMYTALGVVISSFLLKSYVFIIFTFLIAQNPLLLQIVRYMGCSYLIYLSIFYFLHMFDRKNDREAYPPVGQKEICSKKKITNFHAFRMGFLTDLLNPMASINFLGIVVATISSDTPLYIQNFYCLCLIATSLCWYTLIVLFFSHTFFRNIFTRFQIWIEGASSCFLLWFGVKMIL